MGCKRTDCRRFDLNWTLRRYAKVPLQRLDLHPAELDRALAVLERNSSAREAAVLRTSFGVDVEEEAGRSATAGEEIEERNLAWAGGEDPFHCQAQQIARVGQLDVGDDPALDRAGVERVRLGRLGRSEKRSSP